MNHRRKIAIVEMSESSSHRRWQFSLLSVFLAGTISAAACGLALILASQTEIRGWRIVAVLLMTVALAFFTYWQWYRAADRPPGRFASFGQAAFCLYLPFSWLVLMQYPWDPYRFFWLKLWPILPGLLPGAYFFHPQEVIEFTAMGATTAVLLAGLTWLGARDRRGLLAASTLALTVSLPTASIAYALFFV